MMSIVVIGSIIAITASVIFAVLYYYPIYDLYQECKTLGIDQDVCTEEVILDIRCPASTENGVRAAHAVLCVPPDRSLLNQQLVPLAPFLIALVVAFGVSLFAIKIGTERKELVKDTHINT